MRVTLEQVRPEQQAILANLFQFYEYDFSEMVGFPISESGTFSIGDIRELFADAFHFPFFIRVDEALAGFVIVTCPLEGCEIDQFFVLRAYRRHGTGAQAAIHAFDRFPGAWVIKMMGQNVGAQDFWRKVVGRYTDDHFSVRPCDDPSYHNGIMYSFDNGHISNSA